jgi:hypothetical protein
MAEKALENQGARPKMTAVMRNGDLRTAVESLGQTSARVEAMGVAKRQLLAKEAGIGDLSAEMAHSMRPETTLESMACDIATAAFNASMKLVTRASVAKNVDQMVQLTNIAAKMMRAFAETTLAIQKLRGGGRQLVTVQHVVVAEGGQAVVAQGLCPSGGGDKIRG